MKYTADRLSKIQESASGAASQRARDLKAAGVDIISLTTGEPDFPTPPHVIEAAIAALRAGETRYTANGGTPAMRAAVRAKFARENGLEYSNAEVIVSPGAKPVIALALAASVDEGEEVIVPTPAWVSYTDLTKLAGGVPVVIPCKVENGLKLDPATLEAAITVKTRWLLLNSPCNPTGAVYTADEYRALGKVLARHPQVMVMTDEIYEHLLFDGTPFVSFAEAVPEMKDRTLTINGVSKAYAMTGWRIGYAGGPAPLIKAMHKVQSQTIGSNCAVSQAAAIAALEGPQDLLPIRAAEYQARRDRCIALIDAIPGLTCLRPSGAFYLFVNCEKLMAASGMKTDTEVTDYLLDKAHVGTVTGAAYGMPGWFRISIASSMEQLEAACARIAAAVETLSVTESV